MRNRLVHEYMEDIQDFRDAIEIAREQSLMLLHTYNRICDFAKHRMGLAATDMPRAIVLDSQQGK